MNAVIRVDASLAIGTGHVMRCLTLARALRARGADIGFICREQDGDLCGEIEAADFRCSRLPPAPQAEDALQTSAAIRARKVRPDLLVVDHYALDISWESSLRPLVGRIFVIDDLADRAHDCDLLLDQNLHDEPASRYAGLVPEGTQVFTGPRYALLRPEFLGAPPARRTRGLRRMLVFFGGVDATNEALKIVHALRLMGTSAPQTDLVLGPANPHRNEVVDAASGIARLTVLDRTDDMAGLMREADLGIGTCGVAAWERCRVGLPAAVVITAANQRDDACILHALGAVRNLGDARTVTMEQWAAEVRAIGDDPTLLSRMSIAAAAVMDGHGEALRDLEAAIVS